MTTNQESPSAFVESLRAALKYGRLCDVATYIKLSHYNEPSLEQYTPRERLFIQHFHGYSIGKNKRWLLETWADEIVLAAKRGWITAESFKGFEGMGYLALFPYLAFVRLALQTNDPTFVSLAENESLFFSPLSQLKEHLFPLAAQEKAALRTLIFRAMQEMPHEDLFRKLGRMYAEGDGLRQRLALRLGWIAVLFGAANEELNARNVPVNEYLYALIDKIVSSDIPEHDQTLSNVAYFAGVLWDLGLKREAHRVLASLRGKPLPESFVYALLTNQTKTTEALLKLINPADFKYTFRILDYTIYNEIPHPLARRFLSDLRVFHSLVFVFKQKFKEETLEHFTRSALLRFLRSDIMKRNPESVFIFFVTFERRIEIPEGKKPLQEYLLKGLNFFKNQTDASKRVLERKLAAAWMVRESFNPQGDLVQGLTDAVKQDAKLFEIVVLGAQEALNLLPQDKIEVLEKAVKALEPFIAGASEYAGAKYRELISKIAERKLTQEGSDDSRYLNPNLSTERVLPEMPFDGYKRAFDELIEEYTKSEKLNLAKFLKKYSSSHDPELDEMYEFLRNLIGISNRVDFYIPACYAPDLGFIAVKLEKGNIVRQALLPNPPVKNILTLNAENRAFLFYDPDEAESQAIQCADQIGNAVPILLTASAIRGRGISAMSTEITKSKINAVFINQLEDLGMDLSESKLDDNYLVP